MLNAMIIKLLAAKKAYVADESGATAIEYGLIASGIALAIVAAVFAFGGDLSDLFGKMSGALTGTAP